MSLLYEDRHLSLSVPRKITVNYRFLFIFVTFFNVFFILGERFFHLWLKAFLSVRLTVPLSFFLELEVGEFFELNVYIGGRSSTSQCTLTTDGNVHLNDV